MNKISKDDVNLVLSIVLGKGLVFDETILNELYYKTIDDTIELSVNDFVEKCINWAYDTYKLFVNVYKNPEHDIDPHCDNYVTVVEKISTTSHNKEARVVRLAYIGGENKFHSIIKTIVWINDSEGRVQ